MMNSRFVRKCAAPVATAGLILSALMHAAPAIADPSSDDSDDTSDSSDSSDSSESPFYAPHTYAGPGWDYAYSGGPGGDTSVYCSPCAN